MAATINTNIASINAQRNLSLSGQSLNTTMQRLSSGLRVNSAKDDAAGLAIAERMNTQVKGLTVASRNANDGISLAQTAEGALGKIGDMLQRQRELAVQASNATNSESDRKALQAEVSQLAAEIDRVAKQTNFNGQKILDGSFAGAVFQVGANSGDNVTLGALADTRASNLSAINYNMATVDPINVSEADGITNYDKPVPNPDDYATQQTEYDDAVVALKQAQAANPLDQGAVDNAKNEVNAKKTALEAKISELTPKLTIQGIADPISLEAIPAASTGTERIGQVVEAINKKTADTGVTAYLTRNEDGSFKMELMSSRMGPDGVTAATVTLEGFSAKSTGIADADPTFSEPVLEKKIGIDSIDVTTQAGAWIALKKIDSAIDQINGARATLGAMQTRFENAVNNIDIQVENLSAARGRIVDADFAVETANLSRTQILQQAGTAMVAQANQIPQNVLQLLQG
ncbi:flagellin [Comamonas aquatica]|uniref:Flagellin n=1 Tax=Comamonas aquatica TaxID=225991 RepID=A0AA42W317_9BURK|nr:flagellin [Comamonas aquatica]MDH1427102.1 flagellin [Comamonas aquatica]MDH1605525.1 flagellin [Comamonas aquatica]MDH1617614.1 flagellin [Comamonas aquatica]MDH2005583.1 flagellin [Comamonas aquatica]